MEIILASNNAGKLREFQQLTADLPLSIVPQSEFNVSEVAETGLSFVENALIKARHASEICQRPAIADDSGLIVPALQGEPGIYSARYAGEPANDLANNEKLLAKLHELEIQDRRAMFVCLIVKIEHANDPLPKVFQGIWHGQITEQAHGAQGFGYDPLFYVPSDNCTAAQLDPIRKNELSHRGQACRQLLASLKDGQ